MLPIVVEHRRTVFSDKRDFQCFPAHLTVAEIVERLPVPAEFEHFGAVYLKADERDPGHLVDRRYWHRVRPKPGTALFVSTVPQGGDGAKVFAIIAAIALVALTAFVGAGGLSFLTPLLGAGTVGAQIAAAAIAVAGSAILQALTPRPGGGTDAGETVTLGVAGVSQNPIKPYAQIPAALGLIRVSPPLLARPFTTVEDTDQYVHLIAGICGPVEMSRIKINNNLLSDLSALDITVEIREGWTEGPVRVVDLGFEGTAGSTLFRDKARAIREWTAGGAASIDGGTLVLDGTTSYISTTDDPRPGSRNWSFYAEFNATATAGSNRFIAGKADNTGGGAPTRSFDIGRVSDVMRFVVSNGSSLFTVTGTTTFTNLVNPGWHSLLCESRDGVLRMFVDEVQEGGDVSFTGSVNDLEAALLIGARVNNADWWQGALRNVRMTIDGADPALTLVTQSVFEETPNIVMSTHRLKNDQQTLINPNTDSYPSGHMFRIGDRADVFRMTLAFPQGMSKFDSASTKVLIAIRARIRPQTDGAPLPWTNLPEMHIEQAVRGPFRQQLQLYFGGDETELIASTSGETPAFNRFYANNPEWTADPYFTAASPVSIDTNVRHVFAGEDRVMIYLDPEEFGQIPYDIEVQRSFAQTVNAGQFSGTNYLGGLFTFRTAGPPDWSIPTQSEFTSAVGIESYATVRHTYPIAQPGLALIAVKAKNLRIDSVSAEFEPYVPVPTGSPAVWETVEPSSNPAALLRNIRVGSLNKRPSRPELAEGLEEFYAYCDDRGITCSAIFAEGSVEQAASLVANVGDALVRESDKWGVVIDRDRSAEPVAHMFGHHNMTSPLVLQRRFLQGTRGIVVQFADQSQDWQQTELPQPVFDDGVSTATSDMLVEGIPYDGYARADLVRRRARLDLRRARLRATRYAWECHQEQLVAVHGDIVGLAHDVLVNVWGAGRVAAFTAETVGSPPVTYLRTVTLNGKVQDIPEWPSGSPIGLFEVPAIFLVSGMWNLSAPTVGMQVRLPDNTISTIPVASISSGLLLEIEGDVPLPDGFERGALVSVGPTARETRRVMITNITPRRDNFAQIEAIDEAPQIHAGL